jgi:hypothetical protein
MGNILTEGMGKVLDVYKVFAYVGKVRLTGGGRG